MDQSPSQEIRWRGTEGENGGDKHCILAKFGDTEKEGEDNMCLHVFSSDWTYTDKVKYQGLSKSLPIPVVEY